MSIVFDNNTDMMSRLLSWRSGRQIRILVKRTLQSKSNPLGKKNPTGWWDATEAFFYPQYSNQEDCSVLFVYREVFLNLNDPCCACELYDWKTATHLTLVYSDILILTINKWWKSNIHCSSRLLARINLNIIPREISLYCQCGWNAKNTCQADRSADLIIR